MNRIFKKILKGLLIIIAAALVLHLFRCTIQEKDLFYPQNRPAVPDGKTGITDLKNVSIQVSYGEAIRGWILEHPDAGDILIYFYGNAATVYDMRPRLERFAGLLGINVVCFDYRGYGYSDGTAGFAHIYDDALKIYDYIRQEYGASGRIFSYGQSLGTAPAAYLGVHRDISGVILESAFHSAEKSVPAMGENMIPYPLSYIFGFKTSKELVKASPQPIDNIRKLKTPLLMMHCKTDNLLPYRLGVEMFENALSEEKRFVTAHNCSHFPLPFNPGSPVYEAVKEFMARN